MTAPRAIPADRVYRGRDTDLPEAPLIDPRAGQRIYDLHVELDQVRAEKAGLKACLERTRGELAGARVCIEALRADLTDVRRVHRAEIGQHVSAHYRAQTQIAAALFIGAGLGAALTRWRNR